MAYQNIHKNDYHSSAYLVFIEGAASLSTSDILTPLPTSIPGLETGPVLSVPVTPTKPAVGPSVPGLPVTPGGSIGPGGVPGKYGGGL